MLAGELELGSETDCRARLSRRGRQHAAGSARTDRLGKLGQARDEQLLGEAGQEDCLADAAG